MIIRFPRNILVDTNNIPNDFDNLIRTSFEEFTYGTALDYMYQDKLSYIDICRKLLHNADDTQNCVIDLMKNYLEYEVDENGEIPSEEEYLSVEFMETVYDSGRTNLYDHYTGDNHIDDIIMTLLARVIKVIINYEKDGEQK